MWGKIAGIGLVALLTVALVGGSAYILLRPDEAPALYAAHGPDHAEGGRGYGWETAGRSEQGHGYGAEVDRGGGDHSPETWTTVTGTVVAFDHDLLIQTEEGELTVHLGPEWHWETAGLALNPGDQVMVTGFYEEDGFEAASVENLTTGQTATLRDEAGRPMWAGRGRGGHQ